MQLHKAEVIKRVSGSPSVINVAYFTSFLTMFVAPFAHADLVWEKLRVEASLKPGEEVVTAYFPFENAGKTEVTIKRITTSCGCTSAQANKEVFLPGEKGQIAVAYRPGESAGKKTESTIVELDGTVNKSVALQLVVNVEPLLTFSPLRLQWAAGEKPSTKTIKVQLAKEAKFRLVKATASDSRLSVKLDRVDEAGRYELSITPSTTAELVRTAVIVESDQPREKPKRFTAYVAIR